MTEQILGIHHITAISGDPQQTLDFYAGVLGLRLVKLTVNYDDPGTYHLYFGDDGGKPGTIITFFPWPGARKGRPGAGQADTVSFAVPGASIGFWSERLRVLGFGLEGPRARFGQEVLSLTDPHGLHIELVEVGGLAPQGMERVGPVPDEHAIRGFHGITLLESNKDATDRFVRETLGFRPVGEEDHRVRYGIGTDTIGSYLDVLHVPSATPGLVAVGSVHHVAWRTPDQAELLYWQERIREEGRHVTPVIDRNYFHSIYFHEPGRVLFEIATDPPGFAVDEKPSELGTHLMLPPWLEAQRGLIELELPRLTLPGFRRAA
jgi:glyoxalase family protein